MFTRRSYTLKQIYNWKLRLPYLEITYISIIYIIYEKETYIFQAQIYEVAKLLPRFIATCERFNFVIVLFRFCVSTELNRISQETIDTIIDTIIEIHFS